MFIPFLLLFLSKKNFYTPLFKNLTQIYYEEKESASIFRWVINVWMPNERSNQWVQCSSIACYHERAAGTFYLNSDVPIVVNASQEVKHIASGLSTTLLDIAGLKLKPTDELHENVPSIVFDSIPGMEKEAYKLSVTLNW